MKRIIGIDIGGTKCAVILGKYTNDINYISTEPIISIVDKVVFPTKTENGFRYTLNEIFNNIDSILLKNHINYRELWEVGVSCGGPLDSKNGIIKSPPNLYGWDNVPIVKLIEDKIGVDTNLENDANACAIAEWKFGAAKGYRNVIFLTFGTGMGAGIILDNRLYRGTNDMAGEIGHIRLDNYGPVGYGKAGSFEGFCSGGGIAQLAKMKVLEKLQMGEKVSFCKSINKISEINAKIVGEAAEAGDELAKEIYRICGSFLGRGISILIDILNPEIIVIGSIFLREQNLLWKEAEKVIKMEALEMSRRVCKVVPCGLGESIGDFASLAAAIYK
jgi:glucokinase